MNPFQVYQQFQSEVISLVPLLSSNPCLYTNNLDVARQVVGGGARSSFYKPAFVSQALMCVVFLIYAWEFEAWRDSDV